MQSGPILVPVDFEEGSRRALAFAKELARGLGDELALVHVYTLPVYIYPGLGPSPTPFFHPEISDAARAALDQLAKDAGVQRAILRDGDAADQILATAAELGARMIVMGTHGRRGFAHLLLGSVAERIVRQSPIPVVTVRAPATSAAAAG